MILHIFIECHDFVVRRALTPLVVSSDKYAIVCSVFNNRSAFNYRLFNHPVACYRTNLIISKVCTESGNG